MRPYSSKERPRVRGKFFFIGEEKLYLRGATYGTFHPDETGNEYGSRVQAERDLSSMTAEGINAIRVYTVPPSWLLDIALRNSIWVLVGLPWEQHITFLDDDRRPKDIELRIRERVRECKGHPAVLGYTIGNEIPGDIIRWHGRRRLSASSGDSIALQNLRTRTAWSRTSTIQRPSISNFRSWISPVSTSSWNNKTGWMPTSHVSTTSRAISR